MIISYSLKNQYLSNENELQKQWNISRDNITKDLEERLKLIEKAYFNDLSEKDYAKCQREENFIKSIAIFLNDSESVSNIYKNGILSVLDTFSFIEEENIFLKNELALQRAKNDKFTDFLKQEGLYEQYLGKIAEFEA